MERLKVKYKDAVKSLKTFKDVLGEDFSVIVRDASIQRFEYTFEAFWKFLKGYLREKEGIVANSPKGCFREIFSLGFLTEEETEGLLEMTDDRNNTLHTYKEEVAQAIYSRLKKYARLMDGLLDKLKFRS